mgnify:CR=1 FL=1|tara:strand:+ start:21008 stop:22411 length:1404 start_codon:yes stop_codon:yes gene_type:complete
MPFIHDDFLLQSDAARKLYHQFAKDQPILDYHNHLPPEDIATNRTFGDLFEIWLEGDHYKWRAMRSNGAAERFCTGDADPYDKFLAFAETVPNALRNPLYHWTHLELKRYFGIEELLSPSTAEAIWKRANEQLADERLSARGILKDFQVKALCTTDDPTDSLEHHQSISDSDIGTRVYPTFRPDRALMVDQPSVFNPWLDRLRTVANNDVSTYAELCAALESRHDFFHSIGGRLSDHGLEHSYANFCSDAEASRIFAKALSGEPASPEEKSQFAANLMLLFGQWASAKNWTMQLHLGPIRNNNTRLFNQIGTDIGCDSIGDFPQAKSLSSFLGKLSETDSLPKTVIYNINPVDNFTFATMIGNFQDGEIPGKIQFGSGWWFLDQKEGMEWQMNALSNCGLLSRFIGMLTDSRSFMSFPRHEYFRRTLCNLIGDDVEKGLIPDDDSLVGPMVENICFGNAREYLGLEI